LFSADGKTVGGHPPGGAMAAGPVATYRICWLYGRITVGFFEENPSH